MILELISGRMKLMEKISKISKIMLMGILLFHISTAMALETTLEGSLGYDDNPAFSPDGDGSGFAGYRARLNRLLFPELAWINGDIFVEGNYNDYFDLDDNYGGTLGLSLGFPFQEGRFQLGLFGEGAIYRDDLNPEDERDTLLAGAGLEWLAGAQLTLGLRGSAAWLDYREDISEETPDLMPEQGQVPGGGPHHGGLNRGPAGPRGPVSLPGSVPLSGHTTTREDRRYSTEAYAAIYISPTVQVDLIGTHVFGDSTIDAGSYDENRGGISLSWSPLPEWNLYGSLRVWDTDYDGGGDESGWSGTGGISYWWKSAEIYLRLFREENDSDLPEEDYERMVSQCGLRWYF